LSIIIEERHGGKPMKCVKDKETNEITRVYDERAFALVKAGTHIFVTKSEWKDNVRDYGKPAKVALP
jgi:hypothetical protein